MDADVDAIEKLRQIYCPPLDEAVFYAIQADYDLANQQELQQFLLTLDTLKSSALDQDTADFDPSGTGATKFFQHKSPASLSTPDDTSVSNEMTSTGFSELKWDNNTTVGSNLEELSLEEKEKWLCGTFPDISSYTISSTLRQCQERVDRASDELLTISFLEREENPNQPGLPLIPKGIDGFLGDDVIRGRKGKKKKRTKPGTNESSRASSHASALTDISNSRRNVWAKMADDVDYLCSRTTLPQQAVKSVYSANNSSLSDTIRAFAIKNSVKFQSLDELDPQTQLDIVDLRRDLEHLPDSHLFGLLQISRNIPSVARELGEAMVAGANPPGHENMSSFIKYTSPNLGADDELSKSNSPSPSRWTKGEVAQLRSAAAIHGAAAAESYQKAASAYKRGKSDYLMGGAAAYYADVGRDRAKAARESNMAAANALVSSQSSSRVLDLHGVSVADAVRIANDRVSIWWENLGDAKYAPGGGGPVRDGFRIVTGVGRHSKDGAPRIGPAVSRMLLREGWKVEVGHGEIYVYGKSRR